MIRSSRLVSVHIGNGDGIGPGVGGKILRCTEGSVAVTKKDRDVTGSKIGCDNVGEAIPVDVRDGDRPWVGGEASIKLLHRLKRTVAVTEEDADVVAVVVGNDDIQMVIPVQIGSRDGDRD